MNLLADTGRIRRERNPTGTGPHRRRRRRRYFAATPANQSLRELYGRLVSNTLAVRRDRFAKHIRRVVAHVRQTRKWTLQQLLTEANVSKPIYYRWVNGEWTSDLE